MGSFRHGHDRRVERWGLPQHAKPSLQAWDGESSFQQAQSKTPNSRASRPYATPT